MSAPFGVNLTIISGQKSSGEIAVAAATFLSMGYLSISLVAADRSIRPEFLKALELFRLRENMYFQHKPEDFVQELTAPNLNISTKDLFWLALDTRGESLAKSIFEANEELPDKTVYHSIAKLNLIEPEVPAPPQVQLPLDIWEKSRHQHFALSLKFDKKSKTSYHSYMDENLPLLPEQMLYYEWCESLYETLIPWQNIIKNIQSDYS